MGPNEIKMIEKIAENLKEWADNLSYDYSPTFIRFAPDLDPKEVIHWLLVEKHGLSGKVQEGFKLLQEKVCDLNNLSAKAITKTEYDEDFCPRIDEVKGIADDLVETLRFIIVNPAETKQNAPLAKHWKIISWVKEFYGLTIERLFKAILDKYG